MGGLLKSSLSLGLAKLMIPPTSDSPSNSLGRIGSQPIALAAAILFVILVGAASIALWRAYAGTSSEPDRALAARLLQARAVQVSDQLVEKTKGLEQTQQESIDQLQVMQDQLQTVRRQLAAQQADNKRLAEQVAGLTEAVETLRQSFASVQPSEPSQPSVRNRSVRTRAHAVRAVHYRRIKSHG